jgi:hypothetical protein
MDFAPIEGQYHNKYIPEETKNEGKARRTEFPTSYHNVQSAPSGIPVFNPMQSYASMWPSFGYYLPWAGQYSGQFTPPYGCVVPPTLSSYPTSVGLPPKDQFLTQTGSEVSTRNKQIFGIPIDSKLVNLDCDHQRFKLEKLEFEREEIRRGNAITVEEKANNTDRKRNYVIRLDTIRKMKNQLQELKARGFTHYDPETWSGVPSPKVSRLACNQSNGDGAAPSAASSEPLTAVNKAAVVSEDKLVLSPSRRRSHALEIKAPPQDANQFGKPKSNLNPASPSYEPKVPVVAKSGQDRVAPKTPSPSSSQDASYSTTINATKQRSSEQHTDCSASDSSVNTVDFFPMTAAQHSLTRHVSKAHHPMADGTKGPVSNIS